jgi:hypothetical protein
MSRLVAPEFFRVYLFKESKIEFDDIATPNVLQLSSGFGLYELLVGRAPVDMLESSHCSGPILLSGHVSLKDWGTLLLA